MKRPPPVKICITGTPERETDYELRKRKPFYRFATVKLDDEET